ncbi:hypothetical protein A9513_029010 [Pseudomonas sp. AU12215]|nr:hypothetical protein A9513_029010 [Pseudomonas sp. AU12215]
MIADYDKAPALQVVQGFELSLAILNDVEVKAWFAVGYDDQAAGFGLDALDQSGIGGACRVDMHRCGSSHDCLALWWRVEAIKQYVWRLGQHILFG